MVHGAAGQQLFLVVCGLIVVTSPFIVMLLNRRARGVASDASVSLLRWLIGPIVTCAVAASILQVLVLEDLAGTQAPLALVVGLAAVGSIAWAALVMRMTRRQAEVGTRLILVGLASTAALSGLAWLASADGSSAPGEVGVTFLAAADAFLLLACVSPLRRGLERRQLGFADAQLGVVLAVLAVVILVSYVLAGLGHPPAASAASASGVPSSWASSAAGSVTGRRQANERQT